MPPTFEFRIPILPEPAFYSNVKLAALSLERLGGAYASAPITVSIGGHADASVVKAQNRWAEGYPVLWRPVPHEIADRGFSSGADRYEQPPGADVVILMDADACLMRPIDELLAALSKPAVAGLPAHFSPFSRDAAQNEAGWLGLLAAFGFGEPALSHRYSMSEGRCPAYFNYGFVAFGREAFARIHPRIRPLTSRVMERLSDTPQFFFSAQIALSLAILGAGAESLALGPEYNCPNSDEMAVKDPSDIRVLHYLRTELFDRHDFLRDSAKFDAFLARRFDSPVLRGFQAHVRGLNGVFYDEGKSS